MTKDRAATPISVPALVSKEIGEQRGSNEDDERMAALLERGLRKEGHATTLATEGR
ncbi:MAG: hypothetical protein BMS9Abin37_2027 [Acidobacteriota bacterium]|nr:MAG: hypothetical protein BMS9Abin37_2027 [Acidobacteriota bacterium]